MVASGNEVGKISIRVVPNLEDFHEDLERQLKAEEKKQRDKAAAKAKVRADTDTSSIPKDVKKAEKSVGNIEVDVVAGDTKKLISEVQKSTDDLDADVDLKTNLDRFKRRYKSKFQALIADFESNIALTADGELIRESLKGLEDEFDGKLALIDPAKDINTLVRLRREVEKFYRETREDGAELIGRNVVSDTKRVIDRLSALAKFDADLKSQMAQFNEAVEAAKVDSEKTWAELDVKLKLSEDLKWNGRPLTVPVEIDWDRNEFTRNLAALGSGIGKSVSNGLYSIGSAAISAGKGFWKLGENGMIVVAVLGLIAPALALVSGALVTMPAALAAVAVPMAAVALGMDGIKKAAEVLKPEFEELKKVMSDAFQQKFTPIFESFKGGFTDVLKESLPNVTAGLADFAGGIRDSLTSVQGMSQIENIIDNIGAALGRAKEGARDFTSGLLTLVSELSNKFPGLADAFNRTGKSFLEWVDKITTKDAVTGVSQLDTAMNTLGTTLSELGGLATTFFNSGWENLSNADFGKSMSGFVESVDRLVNVTLPQLANAFEGIATALRPAVVMVETIDRILSGLKAKLPSADDFTAAFTGEGSPNKLVFGPLLGGWIDELTGNEYSAKAQAAGAKLATDLSEGLAQGLEAGIELGSPSFTGLENIGPAVSQQIKDAINVSAEDQKQALRSAFTADGVDAAVAQQLTTQITQAIESAKGAMANLGPELQAQIDAATMPLASIGDKVGEAFSTMGPAVATAWQGVVTELTAGTDQIKTAVTGAFDGLSLSATTAFQGIQDSITGAFGFMVLAIGQQAENINTAVGQAFNQIPETIGTALSGMVQAVPDALSGVPEAVRSALSGVPGAVAGAMLPAIDVVSQVMLGIVNVVTAVGAQVAAVAAATFAQFPPAVQGAMAPAIEAVGSIGQQMVSTALSFAGAMESAGRSIGASFAAGIAGSADLVAGAASALMAAARAFIPSSPAEKGPFSGRGWVTYSGESVGEGFAKGMENSTSGVVSTARELMQAVKDIFGSAEGLTLNFNLGGVTEQAEAATKQVQVFGDTLSKVPTGPLNDLAVASGTGGLSAADSKAQRDELSQQLDLLEMERKSLELEKGRAGANNDAIKARLAEIKEQKLQLGLQKDQLDYAKKYGAETEQTGGKVDQFYRDMGEKIFKMPTDFARAIGAQFTQDLGISGQGAIPQLLEQGSQFIFQVANLDTALSAQQTLQRRQGMGLVGR